MEDWDPHVILGVAPDATRDDIRRAYRHLARMYHPDTNPNDERANKRFRMIQRAYRSLSDAEISVPAVENEAPPPRETGSGTSADEDWLGDEIDDGPDDSEEIFEITFEDEFDPDEPEEALDPDDRDLAEPKPARKPRLQVVRVDVRLRQVLKPGATYLDVPGVGRAAVKIPAGADTGTVVPAIVRRGGEIERLALELRLLPDPRFRRQGLDLVTRYRIDTASAWRGKSTNLDTPWGSVRLTIPARSRRGDVVRIPCKGIMGKNGWGNLFVELSKH